jgi:hypothetical protein
MEDPFEIIQQQKKRWIWQQNNYMYIYTIRNINGNNISRQFVIIASLYNWNKLYFQFENNLK